MQVHEYMCPWNVANEHDPTLSGLRATKRSYFAKNETKPLITAGDFNSIRQLLLQYCVQLTWYANCQTVQAKRTSENYENIIFLITPHLMGETSFECKAY